MDEMPIVKGKHACDLLSVEIVSQGHTLSEVVEAFECALKGAGYCFDGHFELVED
jgi:hypothetical protein